MKIIALSSLILFSVGCSQLRNGPSIVFESEGVSISQESGIITATYRYPACLVPSEERKQVVAKFEKGSSDRATGMISIIGALVAVVLKALTE